MIWPLENRNVDENSIIVSIDGIETEDFGYNPSRNEVLLNQSPGSGHFVQISYLYRPEN